jgi:hypothetical protein
MLVFIVLLMTKKRIPNVGIFLLELEDEETPPVRLRSGQALSPSKAKNQSSQDLVFS